MAYEDELHMEEPFQPPMEFVAAFPNLDVGKQEITKKATVKLGFVESAKRTDVASFDYQISGQKQPNGTTSVTTCTLRQGWLEE